MKTVSCAYLKTELFENDDGGDDDDDDDDGDGYILLLQYWFVRKVLLRIQARVEFNGHRFEKFRSR